MSEIQIVGRVKVYPGKIDDFKALVQTCVGAVREKDSGTLQYDWFLNEDLSECMVLERYRNTEAFFEHMGNLGDTMHALFSMGDVSGAILGDPSEAVLNVAAEMGLPVYKYLKGL